MEKQKRIVLIGKTKAGKTTLCQYINKEDLVYHKTQTVQVINDSLIDTPGEYLERVKMRGALNVISVDADVILFVQDATENETMFPPAYAGSFAKPTIGVVTKCDLATEEQISRAAEFLKMAGAEKVFITSSVNGTGCEELLEYLGFSK